MKSPLEYIHHLREQPVHVRERATVFATVAIMGLIFTGWLGSAKEKLSFEPKQPEAVAASGLDASSLATPVAALRDSFAALFAGFSQQSAEEQESVR